MSKYTTEVRFICEEAAGLNESVGYASVNTLISKAIPKIFDFDFPIFDESYRTVLETKIIRHYYTREIGFETVGLWKLNLETLLNEIMPYYNKLYKSELLDFNPFYDVDLSTDKSGKTSGNKDTTRDYDSHETYEDNTVSKDVNISNSNGHSETNNNSVIKRSDTPQGSITDLQSDKYLTEATIQTDSSNNTANSNDNSTRDTTVTKNDERNKDDKETGNEKFLNTEDYLEHVKGKRGGASYSTLLKEYRDTFLNIDMMIIKELNVLFMLLW